MIQKRIEICIGTDRAKNVRVRLSCLLVETATGAIIREHYHSTSLSPGDDLAATRAAVEAHLAMPGDKSGIPAGPWPAVPDAEWAKVEQVCQIMWSA